MDYGESLRYLQAFANFERIPFNYQTGFNLKRMRAVLGLFHHPEKNIQTVLVAGTKGKGSTANFISAIFRANKYQTGLFTSPHLHDVRERIQLNGKIIPKHDFARLLAEIKISLARNKSIFQKTGTPTYYEILTLLAVLYFSEKKVDLAIFEIGMGGRLDAANVLSPLVSVVTPISFDHEQYLGDTLAKIAFEKAAIMRPKGILISGPQLFEAKQVLKNTARRLNAKSFFYGRDFKVEQACESFNGSRFNFRLGNIEWKRLKINLPGNFQIKNAATALATISVLNKSHGFPVRENLVRAGLEKAFWPGRFELVKHNDRQFVIDGAHNDASMKALCESLRAFVPERKFIFILGVSRDKNLERVLLPIRKSAKMIVVTKSENSRAQEPRKIIETMKKLGFQQPVLWAPNLKAAVKLADQYALRKEVIAVAGSLFLAGEARELFKCRKLN